MRRKNTPAPVTTRHERQDTRRSPGEKLGPKWTVSSSSQEGRNLDLSRPGFSSVTILDRIFVFDKELIHAMHSSLNAKTLAVKYVYNLQQPTACNEASNKLLHES
ncbi:hypothetical protein RRG08_013689 [Elysia crispata]|uniref:Uncharacterized protein n=1 Tax=Elysia crispata TaxID=231223 RepID=A0AAE0ZMY2_9GAST|nr:hypothetical protein RRG08_013689 [Elysia crispata]